jgi:hypothetical protein
VPTHRSTPVARAPRACLRALGLAGLLATLSVTRAAAQERNAAIRVQVTVLNAAHADVLGAHALTEGWSDATGGAVPDGLAWRITSGRGPELSVRAERVAAASAAVLPRSAVCEVARAAASACQGQMLPALRVSGGYGTAGLIVQLLSGTTPATEAPVRLTLASIAL